MPAGTRPPDPRSNTLRRSRKGIEQQRLNIWLPVHLHEEVCRRADAEHLEKATIVAFALEAFFAPARRRRRGK